MTRNELLKYINEQAKNLNKLNGVGSYIEKIGSNADRRATKEKFVEFIFEQIFNIVTIENNFYLTDKKERYKRKNNVSDGLDRSIYKFEVIAGRLETKAYNDRVMTARHIDEVKRLVKEKEHISILLFVLQQATGKIAWNEFTNELKDEKIKHTYINVYDDNRSYGDGLPELSEQRLEQIIDKMKNFLGSI